MRPLTLLQTLLWAVATLLVSCLVAATVLWQRRLRTDVPGPRPIALVGNALELLNPVAAMRFVKKLYSIYGNIFRFYIGPKLLIFVSRPEDVARVLCDPKITDRDHYLSEVIGYFLGDGLICNRGDKWKSHRKVIAPTFNVKVLEGFMEVFNEAARTLASHMEEICGRETAIYRWLDPVALDMISETAVGGLPDGFTREDKQDYTENARQLVPLIQERAVRPWLVKLEPLFRWTKLSRESHKVRERLNAYVDSVIEHKVKEMTLEDRHHSEDCLKSDSSLTRRKKRRPFLELFLKSAEHLGIDALDIRSEVLTLLASGFATTSDSMCFTLALLSLHPEWQRAVHQELDEVFARGGNEDYHRNVALEDLSDLKLLERVIKQEEEDNHGSV